MFTHNTLSNHNCAITGRPAAPPAHKRTHKRCDRFRGIAFAYKSPPSRILFSAPPAIYSPPPLPAFVCQCPPHPPPSWVCHSLVSSSSLFDPRIPPHTHRHTLRHTLRQTHYDRNSLDASTQVWGTRKSIWVYLSLRVTSPSMQFNYFFISERTALLYQWTRAPHYTEKTFGL